jgi:transposase-like protein
MKGAKMSNKRRKHSDEFKAKVVLEALREESTLSELGAKYEIHPNVITSWKSEFLRNAVFEINPNKQAKKYQKKLQDAEKEKDHLYKQIGKLTAQNEWAKKKSEEYGLGI